MRMIMDPKPCSFSSATEPNCSLWPECVWGFDKTTQRNCRLWVFESLMLPGKEKCKCKVLCFDFYARSWSPKGTICKICIAMFVGWKGFENMAFGKMKWKEAPETTRYLNMFSPCTSPCNACIDLGENRKRRHGGGGQCNSHTRNPCFECIDTLLPHWDHSCWFFAC